MASTLLVHEDVSAYNLGSECFFTGAAKKEAAKTAI